MAFLSGLAGGLGGVGLGAAVVEVAVDTSALTTGLAKAKGEVASSTNAMSASAKAVGTGFIIAGAAAVIGISKAISKTEELGTATLNLQRITGQSAESASSLLFVADKLGVSSQSLAQGFGLLEKNISKGSTVLDKYGLELRNADGTFKDFNTILEIAADKYISLGDAQQGAAFAQELFGRGGKALIPILQQGGAGIAALEEEAKRYGVVLSQDTVNQVLELAKAHRDLDTSIQGLQVSIGTELVPVLTTMVNALTEAVTIFNLIPGPIKTAGLLLVATTGFLFLLQKATTLAAAAWTPLLGAFTASVPLEEASAAGAVQLSLALDAEAASATGAAAATTGWLAKLALLARGGATGIGLAAPFQVALPQTSEQDAGAAQALIEQADAQHNSNEELAHSAELLHLNAEAIVKARDEGISYTQAVQDLAVGLGATADATGDLTSEEQRLADATTSAAEAQKALAEATKQLVPDLISVQDATKTLAADHQALADAQKAGNTGGARYRNLLLQTAQDAQDLNQAEGELKRTQETSNKTNEQLATRILNLADAHGAAADAAQRQIDKLLGIKRAADALDGTKATVQVDVIERLIRNGL